MSWFSPIFVRLITEKSVLLNVGPMTTFRPRLPKWKMVAVPTVATGKVTIEPVGQLVVPTAKRGSQTALEKYWTPIVLAGAAVRVMVIGAPTSGRTVALPVKLAFTGAPANSVTGFPLCD